jgi:hypothetical protein
VPAGAAVLERGDLGMNAAELGMEPLADQDSVAHQDGAHEGVRADLAAPGFGQHERPSQVGPIALCEDSRHD